MAKESKMKNMKWKGEGFCPARHKDNHKDYCNKHILKGGSFCAGDTCGEGRCKEQATQWFPLMFPEQRYCSKHRRSSAKER